MKLPLGKNDIFDCPEGKYRVVLERVAEPKKRMNKPCRTQLRLTFRTTTGRDHLVAQTFCADMSYGSELYNFVESWLDGKFDQFIDENGEFDLDLLVAQEADVVVVHWKDGKHGKPFVMIAGIYPPGKLVTE